MGYLYRTGVAAGINTITLTNDLVLSIGERAGIKGAGSVSFYYSSGDVGSRVKSSAGVWTNNSALSFAYTVQYDTGPDTIAYKSIKNLNDRFVSTGYAARQSTGKDVYLPMVNRQYPIYTNTAVTVSDTETVVTDYAVLGLPTTYVAVGPPTRLVLYCHGAGSTVSASTNNLSSTRATYLLAKGYAVLDVNGLPGAVFETGEDPTACAGMGGPIALQCYVKALEYFMAKYNLCQDGIFLLGTSMGGLTSGNLLANSNIPFMAVCLEAPITDMYNQAWSKPWFTGAKGTRYQLAKYYNFDNYSTFDFVGSTAPQIETYWQANKSKVVGWDPANFQAVTISGVKSKNHPLPLLIIHSNHDTTSLIASSQAYVDSIKAAGGNAQLRTVDDGGVYSNQHAPMSFTNDVTDPEGVTTKATVREMYLFFKRFDR